MARALNLGRVRRALARLDRVAGEHPELSSDESRRRLDTWIAAEGTREAPEEPAEPDESSEAGSPSSAPPTAAGP